MPPVPSNTVFLGGVCVVSVVSGGCLRDSACYQSVVAFKKVGKVDLVLFSCRQCFQILSVWGVSVLCLWCLEYAWLLSEGSCMLSEYSSIQNSWKR